jgi:predicted MFS family arabinose efflux permease
MKLSTRLFRLIWGGEVDRALRPLLGVGFVGSVAGSTAWVFLGIWAKTHLGATDTQLGVTFLVAALFSGGLGFLGGHLSDRFGRRPLILVGEGGQALALVSFALVGHHTLVGLSLAAVMPALGSLGGAADQAMVADLVAPEHHEAGYAATRVAANLGTTFGPPIGGLLLLFGSWPVFFLGASALSAVALLIAWRYIPRGGTYAPTEAPTRGSFAVIRRDKPFLIFLGSSILASITYVSYEVLLPISLVTTHHVPKALWGFLVVVNPAAVAFFQLRIIRWTARVPAAVKLAVAMPLMGVPFLLLNVTAAIPVVVGIIVLFVIGEMLWIPTSQAAVASFAPPDIRGAYMGFFGSSWSIAWALGPFLGLQVRAASGDETMWTCVALVSLLAGAAGAVAIRGRRVGGVEAVASGA